MSAQKQSLGRGFGSLIPQDLDTAILQEDSQRIQKILITDIVANPDQPRREFDPVALDELAGSLNRHGGLQPIIVVKAGNTGYRIIAGGPRWRAAGIANLSHIPAIVRSLEEVEQIEL